MPYESGKLSVTKGNLATHFLAHGVVNVQPRFQLPGAAPAPPMIGAPPRAMRARHHFDPRQTAMMGAMIQDLSELDLDFTPGNPYMADDLISGPEFVFHGAKVTWDAIYESGGLRAVGENTSITAHVHSSTGSGSGYVSGTRSLGIAHSFAKGLLQEGQGQYGFVYMFHVDGGVVMGTGHTHRQAEVAGLGLVPVKDILLFKWLAAPRRIYQNLDYNATAVPPVLLNNCLVAIGGGATP